MDDQHTKWWLNFFITPDKVEVDYKLPVHIWKSLTATMQWAILESPDTNLIASVSPSIAISSGLGSASQLLFHLSVSSLSSGLFYGPFTYNLTQTCFVAAAAFKMPQYFGNSLASTSALDRDLTRAPDRALAPDWDLDRRAVAQARDLDVSNVTGFWNDMSNIRSFQLAFIDLLCECLVLQPRAHWEIALQTVFIPSIPKRMILLEEETCRYLECVFKKGVFNEGDIYAAAWLLLLDSWLWIAEVYEKPQDSVFQHIVEITKSINHPPLRLAHCIRDLAYGDNTRTEELVSMVKSDNPTYSRMFKDCLWLPNPEVKKINKSIKDRHL